MFIEDMTFSLINNSLNRILGFGVAVYNLAKSLFFPMMLLVVSVPAKLADTDLVDAEYEGIVHLTDGMIGILGLSMIHVLTQLRLFWGLNIQHCIEPYIIQRS